MLMLPEPKESAPAVEFGWVEAGELVLGEEVASSGFCVTGVGSGVVDSGCLGGVLGFGAEVCRGALPGEKVSRIFVPCGLPGRRIGATQEACWWMSAATKSRCMREEAMVPFGVRRWAVKGLPRMSMFNLPPFSGCTAMRFLLDAGEGGLLFFLVAFCGERDEAIDELFIGQAGGFPQLRIHADTGEAGHGVDFVEIDAGSF